MKAKLNNSAVYRAAKSQEKDYTINDGGELTLMVKTSGKKLWRFTYRFGGKQNHLGFGEYPQTTLESARRQSEAARQQIKAGIDPSAYRKAQKAKLKAEAQSETNARKAVDDIAAEITRQIVASGMPTTNIIEFKVTVEVVRWR